MKYSGAYPRPVSEQEASGIAFWRTRPLTSPGSSGSGRRYPRQWSQGRIASSPSPPRRGKDTAELRCPETVTLTSTDRIALRRSPQFGHAWGEGAIDQVGSGVPPCRLVLPTGKFVHFKSSSRVADLLPLFALSLSPNGGSHAIRDRTIRSCWPLRVAGTSPRETDPAQVMASGPVDILPQSRPRFMRVQGPPLHAAIVSGANGRYRWQR